MMAKTTKTTTTVTALEAEALNLMAYDLYNQSNGAKPTEFNDVAGGVWTWSVSDSWPHAKRMFSGVMSSLVQKGLAWSQEDSLAGTGRRRHREEPSDAAIGMTEAGFAVWQTVDNDPSEPKGMDDGTQNPEAGEAPASAEPVREDDETRCKRVMVMFPDTFGLKAFPGQTFMVGRSDSLGLNWSGRFSYQNDDDVMLYIANGQGQGFAKGTVAELRQAMVSGLRMERVEPAKEAKPTKTFAVYADRVVVATVHAATWLEAMELAQDKIGASVTAVRLVRK